MTALPLEALPVPLEQALSARLRTARDAGLRAGAQQAIGQTTRVLIAVMAELGVTELTVPFDAIAAATGGVETSVDPQAQTITYRAVTS